MYCFKSIIFILLASPFLSVHSEANTENLRPPGKAVLPSGSESVYTTEDRLNALEQQLRDLQDFEWNDGGAFSIGNYQYKFVGPVYGYDAGVAACQGIGGRIATVAPRDWSYMVTIMQNIYPSHPGYFHIGLNDKDVEGQFVWEDGVYSWQASTYWAEGQPDDAFPGEDCVVMNTGDLKWYDRTCNFDEYFPVLCERLAQ